MNIRRAKIWFLLPKQEQVENSRAKQNQNGIYSLAAYGTRSWPAPKLDWVTYWNFQFDGNVDRMWTLFSTPPSFSLSLSLYFSISLFLLAHPHPKKPKPLLPYARIYEKILGCIISYSLIESRPPIFDPIPTNGSKREGDGVFLSIGDVTGISTWVALTHTLTHTQTHTHRLAHKPFPIEFQ